MSDQIIDNNGAAGSSARPMFLTVLCILTFVGSAYGMIGNFIGEGSRYLPMWYKLLLVACNALTAFGAWQMWNMKKQGLMIYTVGEILAVILPFILIYGILPSGLADLMGTVMFLMAIFPIAFIIMYWANAKHLK